MLSKSAEYAIRSLVYIQLKNRQEKRPGVAEIATEIEAPIAFTAKILHLLTSRKLLNSMKGRGGGFFLTESQNEQTLYDVILLMEGDGLFKACGIGLKDCSDDHPCPLHYRYVEIRNQLMKLVESETIASMAKKIEQGDAVLSRLIQKKITQ